MNLKEIREYYQSTEAKDLMKEGLGYVSMSERCIQKVKFTPEIIYDFFLMGAEKCLVACLLEHKEMPIHHTMDALLDSLKAWEKIPVKCEKVLLKIEAYKDICSLVKKELESIDEGVYPLLLEGAQELQRFLLDRAARILLECGQG